MFVEKFINTVFKSNTYIIYSEDKIGAWVVDPGDSKQIIDSLEKNGKNLGGILITHSHFDHIYGVNDLCDKFSNVKIFASPDAREGMLSAKINRSYYTDNPFFVKSGAIIIVKDKDIIPISERIFAKVIYTPGHSKDCISYEINRYLFTGDSLIPKIKVYTKSKFGDKIQAKKSIEMIITNFSPNTLICPGHGNICSLNEIVLEDIL